jgi:hypothetical protein
MCQRALYGIVDFCATVQFSVAGAVSGTIAFAGVSARFAMPTVVYGGKGPQRGDGLPDYLTPPAHTASQSAA